MPEGGRIWWEQWKSTFDPGFAVYLDARFEQLDDSIPLVLDIPYFDAKRWYLRNATEQMDQHRPVTFIPPPAILESFSATK
jgi:hypothetical protein